MKIMIVPLFVAGNTTSFAVMILLVTAGILICAVLAALFYALGKRTGDRAFLTEGYRKGQTELLMLLENKYCSPATIARTLDVTEENVLEFMNEYKIQETENIC